MVRFQEVNRIIPLSFLCSVLFSCFLERGPSLALYSMQTGSLPQCRPQPHGNASCQEFILSAARDGGVSTLNKTWPCVTSE